MQCSLEMTYDSKATLDNVTGEVCIECDPQLIEAAVREVIKNSELEEDYHEGRIACYEQKNPEHRERNFARFNHEWFARLDLAQPVLHALAERPQVMAGVARCFIAPANQRKEECAELYRQPEGNEGGCPAPFLVIRLRPDSFKRPWYIRELLLHELMHIHDMLDPEFFYDPSMSQFYDDKGIPTLIRDRYSLIWNTYIDGRLWLENKVDNMNHSRRKLEFFQSFPQLKAQAEEVFERLFNAHHLTHRDILAYAKDPSSMKQLLG